MERESRETRNGTTVATGSTPIGSYASEGRVANHHCGPGIGGGGG